MKIGYMGPDGTFTKQAAIIYKNNIKDAELIKFTTIYDVIIAVGNGQIDEGVVPFENSIEGTVTNTIDALIFDVDLKIKGEIIVPVSHCLLVNKNYNGEKIEKVLSHPQAIAQCRKFLFENYKDSILEKVNSTAESAKIVSLSTENWAGIGTKTAGDLYGLKILMEDIQDDNHNETKFIVISKTSRESMLGGKTSIVFSTKNKPGELYKILDIISIWDLNMTKIESRPMKNELGTYVFFIDIETANRSDMEDALKMIERKTTFFKNLGSYTIIE